MKFFSAPVVAFLVFLATNAISGQYPRDFSGDAMQRHSSRMPSSPMLRFPAVLGLTPWPFIGYPPAPSMSVFNLDIHVPAQPAQMDQPAPSKAPASAQFWIARCGSFVEVDPGKVNLIEEEARQDCAR
jgi:hypothetical protein